MEKKVMAFVDEQRMLNKNDVVIVGVSGGADSVCLLFMLKKLSEIYKLKLRVVHINHCLRGEESDADAKFVEELCKRINVSCRIVSCDVKELAEERGISVEEMGRIVRYESFSDEMEKQNGNKIATAHHMDDNAETMLFNLFRGTGLRGLSGISPVRDNIIRPLMCLSRNEIEAYLDSLGEVYRNDSSNFCDDYTRNKIRHNVMDYVKKHVLESASVHMFGTSMYLRNVDSYLKREAEKIAGDIIEYRPYITLVEKEAFRKVDIALKPYVLSIAWERAAVGQAPLGRRHLDAIIRLAFEDSGKKICLPNNWEASSGYFHIFFFDTTLLEECNEELPIKASGTYEFAYNNERYIIKREKYRGEVNKISKATYTKCFDYDKMGAQPVLRTRQKGDYIIINSKGDKQSLNRYFINEKVPGKLRDRTTVLADGHRILWVVGFRMAEDVKVDENTNTMLIVKREV